MRYSNKIEKTFFQKYLHNPKITAKFSFRNACHALKDIQSYKS